MVRRIVRKVRWERMRNEIVGEFCGIRNVVDTMEKHMWNGDITRMDQNRLLKTARNNKLV